MDNCTKTHLGYIIGILICIIIALLTIKWSEIKELVNYISFGSTLASLLLSILAIIYAFYSNSSFSASISKIDNAADSITKETTKLTGTLVTFDSAIKQIPDAIKSIDGKISETNDIIRSSAKSNKNDNSREQKVVKEIMRYYIENCSWNGLKCLYACKISSDRKVKFNLKKLTDIDPHLSYDYAYGYLVASSCVGFFNHIITDDIMSVDGFLEDLKPILENQIKEAVKQGKIASTETLQEEINKITNFFTIIS